MYIDYAKLWKLLIDKDMTKTDLMELTGISSRVLAKLSKNETVTTDTVARICAALSCDVGDMMECISDDKLSLYAHFRKFGAVVEENDLYQSVEFTANQQKYRVCVSKKSATKATHIHCKADQTVYWEQLYPLSGGIVSPQRVESVLIRPKRNRDEILVVLIKGKPGVITGLDEGIFVSSRNRLRSNDDVYVMSEAAFKLFSLDHT